MTDTPNQVSPERFRELKAMLGGKQGPEDAKAVLRKLADDPATPPILRLNIASAMLDLATSVCSKHNGTPSAGCRARPGKIITPSSGAIRDQRAISSLMGRLMGEPRRGAIS